MDPNGIPTQEQVKETEVPRQLPSNIPIRNESVAEGSMGRISRCHYRDGSTRIVKTAIDPAFNKNLEDEYWTMLVLHDPKEAPCIPEVYDEFRPNKYNSIYAFTMEDLGGYQGLLDFQSRRDLTHSLDTDHKMFILLDLAHTLGYANAQGILHNDIQLQNIMIKETEMKLVDWGNARRIKMDNALTDVEQTMEMLPYLFNNQELIPPSIVRWQQSVASKRYPNPETAWKELFECWKSAISEMEMIERRRRQLTSRRH